ncbi:MAG TPA: c-type cytochrome [Phnomibacter sp.]|nr:c-type cytochrome [Phnomibacter sp.]
MKKLLQAGMVAGATILFFACGGGDTNPANENGGGSEPPKSMVADASSYDPKRGEGKFNESNVTIGALDAAMAAKGEAISGTKCFSCHKTTDEKLVGPGWKGVTERRTPFWIMNFITNPDPMIDKDPEVQAQLELCLVRMPNQSLTDEDARHVLEFMRKSDGAK